MEAGRSDSPSARRVVFLVDDDPDVLDSLEELLQECLPGMEVMMADSISAARAVLGTQRLDVMVCDYKLPDGNGLSLIRETHETAPEVPCILLTGFPDLEMAKDAINKAGVTGILLKPPTPEEFLRIITECLRDRSRKANQTAAFAAALQHSRRLIEEEEK